MDLRNECCERNETGLGDHLPFFISRIGAVLIETGLEGAGMDHRKDGVQVLCHVVCDAPLDEFLSRPFWAYQSRLSGRILRDIRSLYSTGKAV